MQWIRNPSGSNLDNLNNVRYNASRHFRKKKKTYLKAKIEELETNSKVNIVRDLYGGINDFKKKYQPRTINVKTRKESWLQTPTVLWRGRGNISPLERIFLSNIFVFLGWKLFFFNN